jgi:hypothetical protein
VIDPRADGIAVNISQTVFVHFGSAFGGDRST